ncbi:MAG: hypothetical protein KKC55_17750 [Gammaproteobacteria bacterium]|nr:hypothetical protein [Gammaproteobacteria bacterium]
MKSLIWKLRYARYFFGRFGGNSLSDAHLAWQSACISWEEMDGVNHDPIDSADEELSNWRD